MSMMTWSEFKEAVEKQEVNDNTPISFIDVNGKDFLVFIDQEGMAYIA